MASITIPGSVTGIGEHAFKGCAGLTGITIPSNVTSIGESAFEGCGSLKSIKIPSKVTSIGKSAFARSGLAGITIPGSVTSIGSGAFGNCIGLTDISVDLQNEYYKSIDGVLFNYDTTLLHTYPAGKTQESYTVLNDVTGIGETAFRGSSELTSITIPDSVTSIGRYAFYDCNKLTDVYYTSEETQWNNISIGSSNDPIINAAKHYTTPQSDIEMTYADGVVRFTGITDVIAGTVLIEAVYNDDNRPDKVKIYPIEGIKETIKVDSDFAGKKVKFMLWNSLEEMKPMADMIEQ